MTASNRWLLIAALSGLVAVIVGAYGWHGLEAEEHLRDGFLVGVQYQMWHTLALIGIAWLAGGADKEGSAARAPNRAKWAGYAGWLFVAGTAVFSGSLYFYGLTGNVPFSGAAPVGGYTLMAGWAVLAFAATRRD